MIDRAAVVLGCLIAAGVWCAGGLLVLLVTIAHG